MDRMEELQALYFNHGSEELILFFGFSQSQKIILEYNDFPKFENLPFVLISKGLYKEAYKKVNNELSEVEKMIMISEILQCQIRCFDHFYLEENIPSQNSGEI